MSPYQSPLLVTPNLTNKEYISVTPASAGWEHLYFAARKLQQHERFEWETGEHELALAILGGPPRSPPTVEIGAKLDGAQMFLTVCRTRSIYRARHASP